MRSPTAWCCPALHEGFGLPVLEAMVRGVPVVCSDIPALREVAGSAALYFDPRVPADIAARITEVIADTGLAERMRELGARARRASAGRPRRGGRWRAIDGRSRREISCRRVMR